MHFFAILLSIWKKLKKQHFILDAAPVFLQINLKWNIKKSRYLFRFNIISAIRIKCKPSLLTKNSKLLPGFLFSFNLWTETCLYIYLFLMQIVSTTCHITCVSETNELFHDLVKTNFKPLSNILKLNCNNL